MTATLAFQTPQDFKVPYSKKYPKAESQFWIHLLITSCHYEVVQHLWLVDQGNAEDHMEELMIFVIEVEDKVGIIRSNRRHRVVFHSKIHVPLLLMSAVANCGGNECFSFLRSMWYVLCYLERLLLGYAWLETWVAESCPIHHSSHVLPVVELRHPRGAEGRLRGRIAAGPRVAGGTVRGDSGVWRSPSFHVRRVTIACKAAVHVVL